MDKKTDNPFAMLERLFHEPNRLAIMSALCGTGGAGVTFNELKDQCDLTDGNLSRHLKAFEEAGMIRIEKNFVDQKPRTTVFPTNDGVERFVEYLDNLETVLKKAAKATAAQRKKGGDVSKHYHGIIHGPAKA